MQGYSLNMYTKYYLLLLFILLNGSVYFVTQSNIESKIEFSKHYHMQKLLINYEIFLQTQTDKADIIYSTTINTKGLREILSQAYQEQEPKKRDILRKRLYSLLKSRYEEFKAQGLLQYHFVFPGNSSFLRMHKPTKFGDSISDARLDFVEVNQKHTIVRGFSQGKTAHGFRNVYPIFNDNGAYIGSIEISFPSEILQENLNKISHIHSHFLVNKYIFKSKMWSREDRSLRYSASYEHPDYLLTLSKSDESYESVDHIKRRVALLRKEIDSNIKKAHPFSLLSCSSSLDDKMISFYPIQQNITHEISAWIVAYDDVPFISPTIKSSYYIRIIAFLIFSLLLYFIYKTTQQKNRLSKILNSYDENVIFSTTNLQGIITHVSSAFCKISGYSKEELIGVSHSLVRHSDMDKSLFSAMWKSISAGKMWKGEIKNLRKDGTFYWVDAEIEPLFNEKGKSIGYTAVRHDITDKKEIEEIQKEIIFTMGSIGESRSKETGNHVKRVAEYSKLIALKYGLHESEAEMLRQASPMHDIGKLGIPDSILKKPGRLSDEERVIMNTHSELGYNMLNNSSRPLLKTASIVAYEHHEKWDGSGYPQGLIGENIHIYGRITALADVFDALGSERVYKKAWSDEKIFELFKKEKGRHFDPKLVEIFFDNLDEFLKIRESFKD